MKAGQGLEVSGLNAICPYFTMFPISFPLRVLGRRASARQWVLDPFCGRGTTNLAARLLGMPSMGLDSHPLAVAISQAKLLSVTAEEVISEFDTCVEGGRRPQGVPDGRFWELAYHESVLSQLCILRETFLESCDSGARMALRAIILGALHGPRTRSVASHLSNQAPRTYAPKPGYAIRFWESRGLRPTKVDVREAVVRRAKRYYGRVVRPSVGMVVLGDSRDSRAFPDEPEEIAWFVTSPPYYGLRTYFPDQWLRLWFLGGESQVDYGQEGQLQHGSPEQFASDLGRVWRNCVERASPEARLVIRFGGINDRRRDAWEILQLSLRESGWRVETRKEAGTARSGRRQADSFLRRQLSPRSEFDVWARRE